MSIIVISSDFAVAGTEIARKVAEATGFRLVDREILQTISEKRDIPTRKLADALDQVPLVPGIGGNRSRRACLAFIQEATFSELLGDNVVCCGLAAHLYVSGVSHVARVRIHTDPEVRIQQVMALENVSRDKALKRIKKEDRLRQRWAQENFEQDEEDSSLYDLVIELAETGVDKATALICETVQSREFLPITYSIKCLQEKELAARVQAALFDRFPDARVQARDATIIVATKASRRNKYSKVEAIKNAAREIQGVDFVEVHVTGQKIA